MPPLVATEPDAKEHLLAVGSLFPPSDQARAESDAAAAALDAQRASDDEDEQERRRRRRKRWPTALPEPPVDSTFAAGDKQFDGQADPGWLTWEIVTSRAWQAVMVPAMKAIDGDAPAHGPRRRFNTAELEAVHVYRLMARAKTMKEARKLLAGDEGQYARHLLGFDVKAEEMPDHIGDGRYRRRPRKGFDGVPSLATLSRHRDRFSEEQAIGLLNETLTLLVADHADVSEEFREQLRLLFMDGTAVKTDRLAPKMMAIDHWRSLNPGEEPHPDNLREYTNLRGETRTVVVVPPRGKNPRKVTAHDGGYVGKDQPSKHGYGWRVVAAGTHTGLIVGVAVGRNGNDSENLIAEKLLSDPNFKRRTATSRGHNRAGVLVADSAFAHNGVRQLAQDAGYVPCMSSRTPNNPDRVKESDEEVWDLQRRPMFVVNGHREPRCTCGESRTYRRVHATEDRLSIRTEVDCRDTPHKAGCGTFTATVGEWHAGQNHHFLKAVDGREPDLSLGNFLTYHDPLSRLYHRARYGAGGALMGQLAHRWHITGRRKGVTTGATIVYELLIAALAGHAAGIALHHGRAPEGQELNQGIPRRRGPEKFITAAL